jgi:predicted ATP-dependent endonuclease of OLD family
LKATHCDLFFADAAILVEGQAERILVPHFIRYHYDRLSRRYVSLLEIGGSHAHKFRPLIEKLGLTTLILSDLDAVEEIESKGKKRWHSVCPATGEGQKTNNPVLKKWHPAKETIDELANLSSEDRTVHPDPYFSVHVSYQQGIAQSDKKAQNVTIIPRTFEDAFVFTNQKLFKILDGTRTTEKIKSLIDEYEGDELAGELFVLLKTAEKAAFALDVLMYEDPARVSPPEYIAEGLSWLDEELERMGSETVTILTNDSPE